MWFIIEPVFAGAAAGLIGYVAFGRIVPRFLVGLSPPVQIVSVVLLGLLTMLVGLSGLAMLVADLMGVSAAFAWAILIPGVLSTGTLVVVLIIAARVSEEGYSAFREEALVVLTPVVGFVVGAVIGTRRPLDGLRDWWLVAEFQFEIALARFLLASISGAVAGAAAAATQRLLVRSFTRTGSGRRMRS